MTGHFGSVEEQTLKNRYFRQVLFTGKHEQLVVMCLKPGEEIGNEVHPNVDQFFRIEKGRLRFVLDNGKETRVAKNGDAVIVSASTPRRGNQSSTQSTPLQTIQTGPSTRPRRTLIGLKRKSTKPSYALRTDYSQTIGDYSLPSGLLSSDQVNEKSAKNTLRTDLGQPFVERKGF